MKKCLALTAGALASAALCCSAGNAAANLIQNGSFETGDFTDWTIQINSFHMNIVSTPVEDGIYAAQIAGYEYIVDESGKEVSGANTLSQIVADTSGQQYLLSFWRDQEYGTHQTGLTVTWDGATVFSETNPGSTGYQNFTAYVLGTGSDTLEFISYNTPGYTYVDNVSLTAVPEPAAWAMMLVGFGGLGFAAFRRTRKASLSIG